MGLEFVNKVTYSGVNVVTITGVNSNDTYELHLKRAKQTNNNQNLQFRLRRTSGSDESTASYVFSHQRMGAWANSQGTNQSIMNFINFGGTNTYSYPDVNGIFRLVNLYDAGQQSVITGHAVGVPYNATTGGWAFKYNTTFANTSNSHNGITLFPSDGLAMSGEMVLYKVI